jgi:basic amino acid/polyamine antiporter, APA family
MAKPQRGDFQKKLKLFDATALVAGSMIGSGIFIVSADMARSIGSPGWLLAIWGLTGFLTVIAAACYGELVVLFPRAGGQYVYLREAYGPLVAFLYGWAAFLVIQCGTIAAVAMGFAKFTGVLLPWVSGGRTVFEMGFIRVSTVHLVAIASIWVLTVVHMRGIVLGKRVQNAFTSIKAVIVLAVIAAGLWIVKSPEAVAQNARDFWSAGAVRGGLLVPLTGFGLLAALGGAMVGSLFSADAWNNVTFTSSEVVRPRRDIPLSLVLGTIFVCALYFLINVAYLNALPLRGSADGATVFARGIQFAADDRVATAAMESALGVKAALIVAACVMVSTFGCNNGIILASARLYYAMAKDGLFFHNAGLLNRNGVPAAGLVIQAVWTSALCMSGTYSNLLDYVVCTVLLFYILTVVAIFRLRKTRPGLDRPYKAIGYPVVPALYIVLLAAIMVDLAVFKPMYTWPGLILVAMGIPVYAVWRRINRVTI